MFLSPDSDVAWVKRDQHFNVELSLNAKLFGAPSSQLKCRLVWVGLHRSESFSPQI